MDAVRFWTTMVVAGIGTYAIRASFLAVADRPDVLPAPLRRALRHIPPAALAALAAPSILRTDGALDVLGPRALAGVLAAVVAFRTRSVPATVAFGLAALVALERLLG